MRVENWESKLNKYLEDEKRIFIKNKCNNLLELGTKLFSKNNFKEVDLAFSQRGDIIYVKDLINLHDGDIDFNGSFGICLGSQSIIKSEKGLQRFDTIKGKISWRI